MLITGGGVVVLWPISLQVFGVALYSVPTCPKFDLHLFSERNYCLSRGLSISLLLLCLFWYWWSCRFTFDPYHVPHIITHSIYNLLSCVPLLTILFQKY